MTDLYEKAGEVVDGLGYDAKVSSDLKAALLTRLNSLRIGGKGATLDTKLSVPTEVLLRAPTVIELEPVGDDDEKAFLMGLLLMRLYEYVRAHGLAEGTRLKHLVVVEEAHRLLSYVPPTADPERSNVKGKAVETFVNMLSEVRAYGEGFIVAEQIPTKLAPDVIKNTNLKIVHRMVAGDDREILRATMLMAPDQADMLATIAVGQAAAFTEGDDRPVLIQVPYAKLEGTAEMASKRTSDRLVATRMAQVLQGSALAPAYGLFDFYPEADASLRAAFDDAREVMDRQEVQSRVSSTLLSLAVSPELVLTQTGRLLDAIREQLPQRAATGDGLRCALLHAVRWYMGTFGRAYNWPYAALATLQRDSAVALMQASAQLLGEDWRGREPLAQVLRRFRQDYLTACVRMYDPFDACVVVCPSGHCLYRYQARRLLSDARLLTLFDGELQPAAKERRWEGRAALTSIAVQLVGQDSAPDVSRSAGLCFGVQRIAGHPDLLDPARAATITALLESG